MADATRCVKCGYVYWARACEHWGTCPACGTNNDFSKEGAEVMDSESIFIFTEEEVKWSWMMEWCYKHRVPASNSYWWNKAEDAWNKKGDDRTI